MGYSKRRCFSYTLNTDLLINLLCCWFVNWTCGSLPKEAIVALSIIVINQPLGELTTFFLFINLFNSQ